MANETAAVPWVKRIPGWWWILIAGAVVLVALWIGNAVAEQRAHQQQVDEFYCTLSGTQDDPRCQD